MDISQILCHILFTLCHAFATLGSSFGMSLSLNLPLCRLLVNRSTAIAISSLYYAFVYLCKYLYYWCLCVFWQIFVICVCVSMQIFVPCLCVYKQIFVLWLCVSTQIFALRLCVSMQICTYCLKYKHHGTVRYSYMYVCMSWTVSISWASPIC